MTPAGRTAVGAALGLLVAADSPLNTLDISYNQLGNDLLPFLDALPRTTHLRRLNCGENDFTQLTAARLLTAVQANASLIHLEARPALVDDHHMNEGVPELVETEQLVAARSTWNSA